VVIGCSTEHQRNTSGLVKYSKRSWWNSRCIHFPIVADTSKVISLNFGVLGGDYSFNADTRQWSFSGAPIAFRGTYLIDKEGIVRHESINDFPLGRNIDEYLRLLDAQLHVEEYGEVCPANWEEGKDAMKATHEGVSDYLSKH
jgi:peroxiredoxin (alkyl hydroperoxide reductase subunit C)